MTIEEEEDNFGWLDFFIAVVGSIGTFFELCLYPHLSQLIDFVFSKTVSNARPIN